MKTTEAAEIISGSTRMKSQHTSPRNGSAGRRVPMRIPEIPMEGMGPMSWRLPSGEALAEFALEGRVAGRVSSAVDDRYAGVQAQEVGGAGWFFRGGG